MMSSKLILVLQGSGHLAPLGTAWHICANFATCSWEPLTMLNPHIVAVNTVCLRPMSLKTFGLFFTYNTKNLIKLRNLTMTRTVY